MTGLFLRYCSRCNATSAVAASPTGACPGCGESTDLVDAYALIPALAAGMLDAERQAIVADHLTKRK